MTIGFLFDNDGVLIDSSELHWQSWQLLMKEENHFFMDKDKFVRAFGKRNDLILKELLPQFSSEKRALLADRKEKLFRFIARGKVSLLPGMELFLMEIKKKKIPRIIASSTPPENLEMFLSSTVLGDYFDSFVSAEEVSHGKPAPDVFIAAAGKLKLPTSECIVLEDSPAGITAGVKAGCFVVGLETTHRKESLEGSNMIVGSPHELNLKEVLESFENWRS